MQIGSAAALVRNAHGMIVEIPESELELTLKIPGFELVRGKRSLAKGYKSLEEVPWMFPPLTGYRLDGYGRINEFINDNFVSTQKAEATLSLGGLRHVTKPHDKYIHVLLTMFEADRIPDQWVQVCNECFDHLLIPSDWCISVFTESGVTTPMHKLPLFATDFKIYRPETKPFVFGHQNALVEGAQKGWDLVIRAFLTLYKGNPDVKLLLKAREHDWANDRWYYEELRKIPNIELIVGDFSYTELQEKFFSRVNCFVYPSRGEGWGLPPLEAMAHGIPTILTDAHSHTEFSKYGIPIGVQGGSFSFYAGRVKEAGTGYWVEPRFDELVKQMMAVHKNYQHFKVEAVAKVPLLQKKFSGEKFVKNLKQIMGEICASSG